ncbi:MAG: hypothetical protein IKS31_00165 [Clostridia bacterium]|nr:hypothetical protein [Clostridia bacterium]
MKLAALIAAFVIITLTFTGCSESKSAPSGTTADKQKTINTANVLSSNQPTPYDISYSLERYNLIRRAYWVNGQREKANALVCEIEKPLGYIVLFAGNTIFGRFVVDGKVTSLNSYLTPDSEYYELCYGGNSTYKNQWLADVDGSYGENDNGIFFFTPDGKYVEWTGEYMYSDIPFTVENPVVSWEAAE